MFSRKLGFSDRLKFDEKSFNQIVRQLRLAGFSKIEVRIPEKVYSHFRVTTYSPEAFVALKYNFIAQILFAKSEHDSIKFLFVNHSSYVSTFDDKNFPSGHSEKTSYVLETDDPVRLVGLNDFARTLLSENNIRGSFVATTQKLLFFLSSVYLYFYIVVPALIRELPLVGNNIMLTLGLFCSAIVYIFYHITHPGGLYLGPFEHPIISFIRRLWAGDPKNNLVLSFFIWLVKFLAFCLVTIFLGVIASMIWSFIEAPVKAWIHSRFG